MNKKKRYWLVQFRKAKKLKQREVAEYVGISRSFYSDIEQGYKLASYPVLKKIACVLGFDVELFFADELRETSQREAG